MTSVAVRKQRDPIRVLLADDHPVVREGLRAALADDPQIDIVGEASNGEEAVQMAEQLAPDVVLMDITVPRMTGLRATSELSSRAPKTKVLVLSMHDSREYVVQVLRSGASGYVLKDASPTDLRHAIEIVASGAAFFSPSISQVLVERMPPRGARSATSHATVVAARTRGPRTYRRGGVEQADRWLAGHQRANRRDASRADHQEARHP